jgi:hypothetical protein
MFNIVKINILGILAADLDQAVDKFCLPVKLKNKCHMDENILLCLHFKAYAHSLFEIKADINIWFQKPINVEPIMYYIIFR